MLSLRMGLFNTRYHPTHTPYLCSMNTLSIQGTDYTGQASVTKTKLSVSPNRENAFNIGVSEAIDTRGELYSFLLNYYEDKINRDIDLNAVLTIDKDYEYETNLNFKITSDSLEICPYTKEISFSLKVDTAVSKAYERFRTRILWHNSNDKADVTEYTQNVPPVLFQSQDNDLGSAKRFLPTSVIIEILQYNANICGLEFVSSILQSADYKNLVLIPQQFKKAFNNQTYAYQIENLPNLTCTQLLELLKPLFNADYRFIDGKLFFERIDYFETPSEVMFNAEEEYAAGRLTSPCFEFNTEGASRTRNMAYSEDAIDTDANQILYFYNYVKYYDSTSNFLKGEEPVQVRLSPMNFDDEGVAIERHRTSNYKVIFWDGLSRYEAVPDENKTAEWLSFREEPLSGLPYSYTNSLYNRFHFISDPTSNTFNFYEVKEVTWKPEDFCEWVPKLLNESYIPTIDFGEYGIGTASEWDIDLYRRSITFKDLRLK